ncbi:hypothetical protein VCHE16_2897 [Vibrio paracholerae HE-16]|nr:hypothetical protein VCHC02A1_2367 [Vibrio cholerae HC-02A1]EKG60245.1 hypothetical protein VCHC55A1_2393 [Vibrio cholerae HC-55A1]EKG85256.1 hypothetical protein VCHE16_2897 [Vibrio paracholerae HE-16]EKK93443.1 hypothetical protein VCHC1A2_3058 [Vibrio cholerae HC-1A2]EKL99275.1 hypothetical protein VCHC55B2_2568 [Vibrio cholerae HC-55B2]
MKSKIYTHLGLYDEKKYFIYNYSTLDDDLSSIGSRSLV